MNRVIDGSDSTLDLMEKVPVSEKSRPEVEIKLYNVSPPSASIHVLKAYSRPDHNTRQSRRGQCEITQACLHTCR